jgi:NAD(P)H dehydrogenase (quinone)
MIAGLPDTFAEVLSLFDVEAAKGGLYHDGRELSKLIGRPTTPLSAVLPAWLPASNASA